jgi:hypothetical protein
MIDYLSVRLITKHELFDMVELLIETLVEPTYFVFSTVKGSTLDLEHPSLDVSSSNSCQFLLPSGSMGPGYVFQLLFL